MSKPLNLRRARHRQSPDAPDPAERVAALTRTARGTWLGLLSYLAFVGVTLMGVQDADFFLTERETALPLIGVSVPTNLFFYIAPTLGAMLYIHMHLYLLKLWKALAEVPSDGTRPAGEGIAPWIVSDMALAQRDGATHAYPLRSLARWVAILSIFAGGPLVLAAFWWRSMPKHDELLTIVFCGLPLFSSVLAGWESWRALRRGGGEVRHMRRRTKVGWGAGLVALSVIGFLTTEGGITERFLRPAQLQGVVFVETPPDWLPPNEAEQVFRRDWCADRGIALLACGPGPLARDDWGKKIDGPESLPQKRGRWCREVIDEATPEACAAFFAELDESYEKTWRKARRQALNALPARDLSGADLRGANLSGARMEGAYLSYARMEGARLSEARMEGADLSYARMEGADLGGARLEGADLIAARMDGADLRYARMEGAVLIRARMQGADLRYARMEGADLGGARMEGADLSSTAMEGADLSEARMEGADLSAARMEGAVLRYARMEGVGLSWAWMEGAVLFEARFDDSTNWTGALLRGAAVQLVDFTSTPVSADQINSVFGDARVILPEGMDRPAHWPDWELPNFGEHDFDTEWRKWRDNPEGYVPPPAPGE